MKNIVFVLALVILAGIASRDARAATALLEVTRPVGGEVYLVGQTQQVRVTSKFKSVTIQISRDGGATFTDLGVIDNTVKDKTLQNLLKYTVTGPAANNCIVRASGATAKGEVVAESGGFVITTGNTLAPVITTDLADGSVTTPKLADGAVTAVKVSSGAASAGFLLTADGAGGADWAALDTVGLDSRYVLKAGDKMTGALTLSGNPTLSLHAAPKQYVDAETTRAQNTETLLTTLLIGESTRASNAEGTLTTNLNAEVTRAQSAEGALTTALSAEVTRAQGAEGTLTTALSAETTRAQAAENTLTTALNAEVTARTSAGTTLQANIDGKVSKSGDSMSGALTLNGNPVASLHAAPKQYVDAETTRAQSAEGTLTTNLTAETTARTGADTALQASINTKVAKAGDTMSGPLVLSGDPSLNLHAATKQYVDAETTRAQTAEGTLTTNLSAEIARATAAESTLTSGKVAKAGDTMTGLLVLSGNPVLALHAAPKQYVDAETTRAQGAEGTLTTNLSAEITRATAAESTLTTSVNGKVAKAGDTMTGPLVVQGGAPANVPLTVQGVGASQTANLQAWFNGGASPVASVSPSGVLSSAGIKFADNTLQTTAAFNVPTGYMILGATTTPPSGYTYTGSFISTSNIAWTAKASMPTAREYLGVASANSLIYAIGGTADNTTALATNESYDPTTDTWTAKAPMLTARLEHVLCAVNGKIYAIGGRFNKTTSSILAINEVYDPSNNSWASKAPMPTAREQSAVAVVNGIIYVIGGDDNSGSLATVEAYDPTSNSWSTKTSMLTARYSLGAAVVNNVIYAIGGNSGGGLPTNEAYDPATNSWSAKAPLPSARYGLGAASVNNIIYAFGGYDALNGFNSTSVSYNPASDSWTVVAPMITSRSYIGAAVLNNLIYAIGGISVGPLSTNEVYDSTVNFYSPVYLHMKN